jgi:hypothetical protein
MKVYKLNEMKGGWFTGNFSPTSFKTELFESCYKIHKKGEKWESHYHKKATEINLLIKGKMIIQDTDLNSGERFVIPPYEIADPVFLEDCEIVIIKTPSNTQDKFEIEIK